MRFSWTLVVALLANRTVIAATPRRRSFDTHSYYVVEHAPRDSGASLDDVARALGVEVIERVGELRDHWLVRSEKSSSELVARDPVAREVDPVLETFENLRRQASSGLVSRSEGDHDARAVVDAVRHLARQTLEQREKRAPPLFRPPASAASVAQRFGIEDPLFTDQWHIVNDKYPDHMMNVAPVWEMGITGKGVISSVVDDGVDFTSEDLAANFDADHSYDFNDHEPLPYPKKANDHHGTRCAGQIAAGRNNHCGVGIAYDSKIAAVRILSAPISDVDEAAALNYGYQNVSIYSCSWGPRDNGGSMGAPSYLIKKAVINGINNGRAGKGSIFVFASGNGGGHEDQCNFDGYTNSIYSVTVGAVDYKGKHPWYSETCAANMVVAYSSGSGNHIVTTDKGKDECATNHGGTSAAAPNAAGVYALALQTRPDLTWRDIQYLTRETAKIINPNDPDWEPTASGRLYSYKYGYGVLDAYKFVTAAQNWKLVKPQAWFESPAVQLEGGKMDGSKKYSGGTQITSHGVGSKITITKDMLKNNNFESLEHVTIQVWIDHTRRGDVEVELVSPNGIKSILAKTRSGDEATTGFPGWVFMSVKHWGENPVGDWTIRVSDQGSEQESGKFLGWRMKFWGSTIDPKQAEKYELPLVDDVLPPINDPSRPVVDIPTVTTHHSKPTGYLDDPHAIHTSAPLGPKPHESSAASKESDPGSLLGDMSETFKTHKTFFGGAGALILIALVIGIILLKRRANTLKNYAPLGTNDNQMGAVGAVVYGPEREGLGRSPGGRHPQDRLPAGLGFHSSFLDDDELSTAGTGLPHKYRDEPDSGEATATAGPSSSMPVPEMRVSIPHVSTDGSRAV